MIPFRHKWEIDNIQKLFEQDNITGHPCITSSIFAPEDNKDYEFKLVLYPMGDDEENKDYFSLFLNIESCIEDEVAVQYKLSIIDCKGDKCNQKGSVEIFTKENQWGIGKYFSRESLLGTDNGILKNNKLTVLCEAEIIVKGEELSQTDLDNHFSVFEVKEFYSIQTTTSYFNVHIKTIPFSHQWTIDNISDLFNDKLNEEPKIALPIILTLNDTPYHFNLLMVLNANFENKKYTLLTLQSESSLMFNFQIKFSIIDQNGIKFNTKDYFNIFEKNIPAATFILQETLLNSVNGLLKNNKLTLLCEGEIMVEDGKDLSEMDQINRFQIFLNKKFNNLPVPSTSYFNTRIELKTIPFAHKWTIDKFSKLCNDRLMGHPLIITPEFSPPNHNEFKCHLGLFPMGKNDDDKDYISIIMRTKSSFEDKITVLYKLSIINWEGDKSNTKGMAYRCTKNFDSGSIKYILRKSLLNSNNEFLKDDMLTILCAGEIIVDGDVLSDTDLENHCRILISKELDDSLTSKSYFNSHPQTIPFTHQWTIDNITNLIGDPLTKHPSIESSNFSPLNNTQYQFNFQIFPKGEIKENKDYISLFLVLVRSLEDKVAVQFKLSIIDCNGNKCETKVGCNLLIENSSFGMRFDKYISHEKLLNPSKKLLNNDKLTLLCEGEVIVDKDKLSEADLGNLYRIYENKQNYVAEKNEENVFGKFDPIQQNIESPQTENGQFQQDDEKLDPIQQNIQSNEKIENEDENFEQDKENLDKIQQNNKTIEMFEIIENNITKQKSAIDRTIITVNNIYHEHYFENANFKDSVVNNKSQSNIGDININSKLSDCTEFINKLQAIVSNEIKPVLDQNEKIVIEMESLKSNNSMLIEMILRNQKLNVEDRQEMKTIQNELSEMKQTKNLTQPEMKQTVDRVLLFLNRIKFEMNKVVVNISSQIQQSIATQQKSTKATSEKLNSFSNNILLHTDPLIKYLQSVPATVLINNETKESHIQNVENAKKFLITYLSSEIAANPNSNFMIDPLTLEKAEQQLSDIIGDQTSDSNMNDQQKLVRLCGLMVEFKPEFNEVLPNEENNSKS